jgi:hypothetical protein
MAGVHDTHQRMTGRRSVEEGAAYRTPDLILQPGALDRDLVGLSKELGGEALLSLGLCVGGPDQVAGDGGNRHHWFSERCGGA